MAGSQHMLESRIEGLQVCMPQRLDDLPRSSFGYQSGKQLRCKLMSSSGCVCSPLVQPNPSLGTYRKSVPWLPLTLALVGRSDSLFSINQMAELDSIKLLGDDTIEVDKGQDHHVYPSVGQSSRVIMV
jgi:hypothetical protein